MTLYLALLITLALWTLVSGCLFIHIFKRDVNFKLFNGKSQLTQKGWLTLAFLTGPIGWFIFFVVFVVTLVTYYVDDFAGRNIGE